MSLSLNSGAAWRSHVIGECLRQVQCVYDSRILGPLSISITCMLIKCHLFAAGKRPCYDFQYMDAMCPNVQYIYAWPIRKIRFLTYYNKIWPDGHCQGLVLVSKSMVCKCGVCTDKVCKIICISWIHSSSNTQFLPLHDNWFAAVVAIVHTTEALPFARTCLYCMESVLQQWKRPIRIHMKNSTFLPEMPGMWCGKKLEFYNRTIFLTVFCFSNCQA